MQYLKEFHFFGKNDLLEFHLKKGGHSRGGLSMEKTVYKIFLTCRNIVE